MRNLTVLSGVLAVGLLGAACGGPENAIVDNYFKSVRSGDTQTLSSFATVPFPGTVQSWTIKGSEPDTKGPAALADLVAKRNDLDAQIAANKKAAQTFMLDNPAEGTQVQDLLRSGGKIPPKLATFAAKWDEFNTKDRDLKKALADATSAVDREKRLVTMSLTSPTDDIESLSGDVNTKTVNVDVTSEGDTKPYAMTLTRYELKSGEQKLNSRWVVTGLTAK
jgi:hypothetical protein